MIAEVRVDLGKTEAAKHLVLSQMAKLNAEHEKLGEQIDAALAHERDDLAKAAIGQRPTSRICYRCCKIARRAVGAGKELESYIVALLAKEART